MPYFFTKRMWKNKRL